MIQGYLIVVFAYLLTECIFQTRALYLKKYQLEPIQKAPFLRKGLFLHALYHGLTTLVLLIIFQLFDIKFFFISLLVMVYHYILDLGKIKFKKRYLGENDFFLSSVLTKHTFYYVTTHFLNILGFYFILLLFNKVYLPGQLFISFEQLKVGVKIINPTSKVILLMIFFLLLIFGSGDLIKNIFKDLKTYPLELLDDKKLSNEQSLEEAAPFIPVEKTIKLINPNKDEVMESTHTYKFLYDVERENTGKYIGYLERGIICMFVFLQAYSALTLLAGFKTLTRFKQLESKSFAEYYLVGTLLSLGLGLMNGLILRLIVSL